MTAYVRKLLMRQVDVPEGTNGSWRVERFEVTEKDAESERFRAQLAALQGHLYRPVPAGQYTRLMCGDVVVMSDTPDEMRDHYGAVKKAEGRVFVAGLGLGMVVQAMLDKPEVEHVTVLELSPRVIDLVAPHYLAEHGSRLEIVQGDAFTWRPPKGTHLNPFDAAWFDIWDYKCSDNLKDITKIKRRWVRWARWRGFWGEGYCRMLKDRGW